MNQPRLLSQPITILFTSVGNEAIHGFAADLRRRAPLWRLVGTDIRDDAAGLLRCDRGVLVPRRDDPAFLETLRQLCDQERADLVVPLSTEDQDFFCRPEVRARLGRPVMVSSPEAVAAANGKLSLFAALEHLPELLPRSRVARDPDEAIAVLSELIADDGAALLKTDRGAGGAGMLCLGAPAADPAPTAGRTWLDLDAAQELLRRSPRSSWPRQAVAWLPGDEYSVDLLGDRGEPLGGVVRLRRAAIGGMATDAATVDEPEVLEAAATILGELGLSYVNNIQLRRDAAGRPKLMEINPRIPGSIGLTVEAGLDLPLAAFCLALGERLPLPQPEIGVRMLRYAGSVYSHFEDVNFETSRSPAAPVIVWDLDRTLVKLEISRDDVASWKERLGRRLEPLGWRGALSPLLPSLEAALDQICSDLAPTEALKLRSEVYHDLNRWELAAIRSAEPIEGALERLRACAEAGFDMAVASNSGPGAVALGLEIIDEWFASRGAAAPKLVAIHRHPLLRAKASPAMFLAALETLCPAAGEPPSLVVVVGDSPHDEAASRALARRYPAPVVFFEAREGRLTPRDRALADHPRLEALLAGDDDHPYRGSTAGSGRRRR